MPLRAALENQDFYAEDLEEQDRGKNFTCPFCSDVFIPVIKTTYRIKHFRHKNGHEHWEPETREHLEMKMMVAKGAKLLGRPVQIEVPIGNFIADLVVGGYAVECQCSPVSFDYFKEKSCFYRSKNLIPLWIFGGKWFENTRKEVLHERKHAYLGTKGYFKFYGEKSYYIQRINLIERYCLTIRYAHSLYYYGFNRFWYGDFHFRKCSKVYGWYRLNKISLEEILAWGSAI